MRKLITGACLLVVLASSCGDGKRKASSGEMPAEGTDSSATVAASRVTADPGIPATADESFADFFYNFAGDGKFRRERVVPSLLRQTSNENDSAGKDAWEHDFLFSEEETYTVLFDKEDDIDMEEDTTVRNVQVERIYLKEQIIKRYRFVRVKGLWTLEAIEQEDMPKGSGNKEDFYAFYARFANDSVFQLSRLRKPLKFVTADPDDDFQTLETTLETGQWFAFQPPLPREILTNIDYGQNNDTNSNTKVIEVKGFGNGFNNTLCFERRHGVWKLVMFEDLSD